MATRLKVLQISHDYQGPFQQICRLYCEAFSNSDVTTLYLRGGEDPKVVEATGGNQTLFFDQPAGSLRGLKLRALLRLFNLFKKDRYDIVIAHRYKAIYMVGIVSYFFPIRVVYGVAHEFKVFKRVFRSFFITRLRRNIQVLTVSKVLREDVLSDCPSLGIENRVHVLENAIDPALASEFASQAEARKALGVMPDKFCYGTVGRLVSRKYQDVLLRAYAQIANEDNCLVIVGSGPQESLLKKLSVDLGISGQVVFTGNVPEAYRYYCAFNAFVFTSDDREAFGIVLLEAMLSKVPIICSDAIMPKEIVADTGLIFETGEVDKLSSQMEKIESMTQDEYQLIQQQGFDRLMANYTIEHFIKNCHRLPQLSSGGGSL
jgi:glycosyltransferase involved in cell wall biosynthesis